MVTREDKIEQSVMDYVKAELVARGYPETLVKVREAFPTPEERSAPLSITTVAIGFNFDDGGRQVELGSNMTLFTHTIELWVFGKTPQLGRNVANVLRAIAKDDDGLVPLKDYGEPGAPVIDQLQLVDNRGVVVQRQIAPDPRPWDLNVWTTTTKYEDYYDPDLDD